MYESLIGIRVQFYFIALQIKYETGKRSVKLFEQTVANFMSKSRNRKDNKNGVKKTQEIISLFVDEIKEHFPISTIYKKNRI